MAAAAIDRMASMLAPSPTGATPLRAVRTRRRAPVHILAFTAAAAMLAAVPGARAADPVAYTVNMAGTGDRSMDAALHASSELEALRASGPIAPFALVGRAQLDVQRLQTVLQSFGYYQGKVTVTIDGSPLDDPELVSRIDALPNGTNAVVDLAFVSGPQYHLRNVTVEGELPPEMRASVGLASGQPAVASEVLAAQSRLLTALQEAGYALAKVDVPIAYEDPSAQVLDIVLKVDAGPRVDLGEITFAGLQRVNESLVRNRLLLHTGDAYSPSKLESARQDLLSLGVFSGITVRASDHLDSRGRLPITFDVQERLLHAVGFTGAYSTDLGFSAKATWSHRDLFGNAEQLNLAGGVTSVGGRSTTGLGYAVTAQYVQPEFLARDQSLEVNLGAIRQKLEAYDQDAVTASTLVNRKFTPRWSGSAGVSVEREKILQEMVTRNYSLLGFPVTARYDSTGLVNSLQDPVRGIRGAVTVTPTHSFGAAGASFVVMQANGAAYLDLGSFGWTAPERSVVAVRGLVGVAQGASQFSLPPDQRFYGGGSATVRGYRYQSIGPQFPDGQPIGGTSIDAATIEFRQRFSLANLGAVAFVDAGQVGTSAPFQGTLHVGAGVGVRYYTAIGPIRLDVAVPLNKQSGNDSFELYIGLGQAF